MEKSRRWIMVLSFFLTALILFFASDSSAQIYKYKDKDGKVTYTDNLSSPMVREGVSPKDDKPKTEGVQKKKATEGGKNENVKDVGQLGEELLEKELAKPPEKQNQKLIQELREALYGEGGDKKLQASKEPESKDWNLLNKLGIKTSKNP
jgi:hypothetical protein